MIEKIKDILSKGVEHSKKYPSEIAKIYKAIKGSDLCSYCPGKIENFFNELLAMPNKKIEYMNTRKYRMKPGKMIDTLMGPNTSLPSGQFTDQNITDEIAIKFIKAGYGNRFVGDPKPESIIDADFSEEEKLDTPEEINSSIPVPRQEENKNKSIKTYSYTRLVEFCNRNAFPKEEWKEFDTRKKLLAYVQTKIS